MKEKYDDKLLKPVNFYKVMPKKFLNKPSNPYYEHHKISVPFRLILCGGSGSMKTNTAMNIIRAMPDTFHNIIAVTKNSDEPLYNFLRDKMKGFQIYEGINKIPDLDTFDKKENSLIIFDDLVLEKNQQYIEQYAIRCRKLGVSFLYLTQVWYKVPISIRQNCNYIVLKKIGQTSDLMRVLKDYSLGVSKEVLMELYKYAIAGEKQNFFLIDIEADDGEKFRKNFSVIKMEIE
jgi:hypothetical protein